MSRLEDVSGFLLTVRIETQSVRMSRLEVSSGVVKPFPSIPTQSVRMSRLEALMSCSPVSAVPDTICVYEWVGSITFCHSCF